MSDLKDIIQIIASFDLIEKVDQPITCSAKSSTSLITKRSHKILINAGFVSRNKELTLWLRDVLPASMFPQESYQLIIDFSSASGHVYDFSLLMNSILKERDWIRQSERDRKITYHYLSPTNPVDLAKEVEEIRTEVLTAITDLHETNTIADLVYGYMGFQVSLWFGNYTSSPFSIYISRVMEL